MPLARILRAPVAASATLLAVLVLPAVLSAQAAGEQPFLLALPGDRVIVNYAPGALDRGHHVQRRFDLLVADASRWSDQKLRLRVFVLGRQEWQEMGFGLPYGLPGRMPGNVLAVPAAGDDDTVALWTRLTGGPPPPLAGTPMRGTAAEASSLALADLLGEVEAARVLLASAGVRGETAWVQQVTAHLLALAVFERYERARLAEIGRFFDSLGHGVDSATGLDGYAPGLDLATLLWFESRFHDGARRVLESGKKNEAKAVLELARKNGGLLTRAALIELYPQLAAWLRESFPPAGSR